MNEKLQAYIQHAEESLAERERIGYEELEASRLRDQNCQRKVLELARQLFPDFIAEYISFYGWADYYANGKHAHAVVLIDIPSAAPIIANVNVVMDDDLEIQKVSISEYHDGGYVLMRYVSYMEQEKGTWICVLNPNTYQNYKIFDHAFEMAVSLGNNKADVELECAEKNKQAANPEPVREVIQFCPLSVAVEGEVGYCIKNQCAWWVARNGKCAVLHMATLYDPGDE